MKFKIIPSKIILRNLLLHLGLTIIDFKISTGYLSTEKFYHKAL